MSCAESWEGGGTRGRRRGRQELNNLLCYWLMLHCRHLELIAAFFPFPSIFICFAVLDLSMVYWMYSIFPIPTVQSYITFHSQLNSAALFCSLCTVYGVSVCGVRVRACVCALYELSLSVTRDLTTCGNERLGARERCPAQMELTLPFH